MLKKVAIGVVVAGLTGILVFGAVNRTLDRTGKVAEAQGQGNGQGRSGEEVAQGQGNGRGRSAEELIARGGNGRGSGQGGAAERQYPNYDALAEDWMTVEGTVVQVPEPGVELVIETNDGEQLEIGTGPLDLAAEGFALQAGEPVQVSGYWEENEFKAGQLIRMTSGQTITLRDEFSRPVWAGNGRSSQQAGWSGNGSQALENPPADGGGFGQAEVGVWQEITGNVLSVDTAALIIQTSAGEEVEVTGRSWRFAQEQGFTAQADDVLTLVGFYEGDEFEVGRMDHLSSGQSVVLRDENGRPMWAGRGGRGL
jgi:hypothetical protein